MKRTLVIGLKVAIAVLVGTACAIFMTRTFRPGEIWITLQTLPVAELALTTGLLYLLILLLKAFRLKLILAAHGSSVRFHTAYFVTAVFSSLAMVTPAQVGEAAKLAYLGRQKSITLGDGVSCFVFEKGLDLAAVLLLGLIALFGPREPGWIVILAALGTALTVVCTRSLIGAFPLRKAEFAQILLQPKLLLLTAMISIAIWLIIAFAWHLVFNSVVEGLGFADAVRAMCTSTLAILFSFVPGGLGVSEVTISETLQLIGVQPVYAQAIALIIRLLGIWWIAISILHWTFMPAKQAMLRTEL